MCLLTSMLSVWPQVLEEEISPKLEKLRGERAGYMKVRVLPGHLPSQGAHTSMAVEQWSSNNTEIERLERFSAAHDFHQAESTRAECDDKAKAVQDELAALQAESEESLQVVATHDAQIAELTRSKEQEMGSEFKEMEHQVTEKSKKMVRLAVVYRFGCYGRGSVRWTEFSDHVRTCSRRSSTLLRGKTRRRPTRRRLRAVLECTTASPNLASSWRI